jgi:hypothetical protein
MQRRQPNPQTPLLQSLPPLALLLVLVTEAVLNGCRFFLLKV